MTCSPQIRQEGLWGGRLLHFHSLPSTNTWAIQNPDSCGHGDIILADDQTHGRGRFERKWSSARTKSLTLSFIIDSTRFPRIARENCAQVAALAVWQLLSELRIRALLKWPNDVMTPGGKICGILAESISDTKIVIGIGINISVQLDAADLASPYTTIQKEADEDVPSSSKLAAKLAECVSSAFEYCDSSGLEHLLSTWTANDYLAGKSLTVRSASGEFTGTYAGITEDGLLRLNADGKTELFHSGDVTLASEQP